MKNSTLLRRKSGILLLMASLFLFAGTGSLSAQLSFSAKEPTIGQIIESVKSQSNYQFFYDSKLSGVKVNPVALSDVSLDALLRDALKGHNVTYKIEDNICYLSMVDSPQATTPAGEKIVSGTVTDNKGVPVIGVTITVSGTGLGVATNFEGKYSIKVPGNTSQLTFSYIGYNTQVLAIGARSVLNVSMQESSIVVDDVVVTAMGIKRETKALTYNVQSIASDELTTVKDANLMNSLAGKIAGVTINQSSSGVGGSTRVVMRGAKSLFGDNNALYVLDGIPLSSLKAKQSDNYYMVDIQGDSEGISNINPDDIESMSVLTGAAAAALYGNRGSNGVVIITTKRGAAGSTKVTYSNNTSFSSPFVMPEFQNTYGRSGESYSSWGDKLSTPSSYRPKDFFQTGGNTMNTVSVSTGNDKHQVHASLGAVNARGIIPNNKYNRYNFTFRSSSELVEDKVTLDLSAYYIEQNDQNMIGQGMYYNPLVAIYLFPPGDDINRFRPYKLWNADRTFQTQYWSYSTEGFEGIKQNPFWIINRNMFNNERNRAIFSGSLNYKITDWINVSFRARMDRSDAAFKRKLYASTNILFAHSDKGFFSDYTMKNRNLYADFLINIDKSFGDNWRVTANIGGSFNDERSIYDGYDGTLITTDIFHKSNVNVERKDHERETTRTTAWYATAQVGFKNMIYADVTGRIDYFSTMYSPENRNPNVFYPSVGLSAVVSEIFDLPRNIVPLWKIRASYSQVGNPPPPYLTREYVEIVNGVPSPGSYPLDLKSEKTKAFEIGTDARLFQNKLDLSFTYYNTNTYNQLFRYDLPPSTGYPYTYANAGKVNNWGIELRAGITQDIGPVRWNGIVTYTLNRNKIKTLLPDEVPDPSSSTGQMMKAPKEFTVSNAEGTYLMKLVKGGTMSDIYVNTFKRDFNGYIYVNPGTGMPVIDTENYVKVGSASPKYNLSMRNNFEYKGVTLGFMLDARVGGIVVSSTQALMDQYGVSKATAKARDKGGVHLNMGNMSAQPYYESISSGKNGRALSEYTYSATNVRLRELTISYDLPEKWFKDKLNMTVSLIGRNLFMLYNKAPFDPELTANTGTYYQGYDYFMPPSVRTFGFGLKVTF